MSMKIMKTVRRLPKITLVFTTLIATALCALKPASSQQVIRVMVNDARVDFGGVPPIQTGGRVLVPLRGIFEALGATVEYDRASSVVSATRGSTQIVLPIGSSQAKINASSVTLDVPSLVQRGRVFVPLRFVSEALGATLYWNSTLGEVLITSSVPETASDTEVVLAPKVKKRVEKSLLQLKPVEGRWLEKSDVTICR